MSKIQLAVRSVLSLLLFTILPSCSGGGSSTQPANTTTTAAGNPVSTQEGNTNIIGRTLLPTATQSNSLGLQLVRASNGNLHATYADTEGRILYAQCSNTCGQGSAWRQVVIDSVELGFSGYAIARLELTAADQPRIAFHVVPGSFDAGNTHFAECNADCLTASNWNSAGVLGHGGNLLEFRLAETDWFALDSAGNPVLAYMMKNGLLDTEARVRLLHCERACTRNENWEERIIASIPFVLNRPVSIDISDTGEFNLAVHVERTGSNAAVLGWFGCNADCLADGAWDQIQLQTVETDLNSLPGVSLSARSGGGATVLSYDDVDAATLTLHACVSNCSTPSNWVERRISDKVNLSGAIYDAGYGVDSRYDGNALELVFAAKASDSPLRQLVVRARCETDCASTNAVWSSEVLTRTDEQLDDNGVCIFIGTRVYSSLSAVAGAIGFTASPQWACGLEPLLVIGPDGERSYDNAADIRFLELSSVVSY